MLTYLYLAGRHLGEGDLSWPKLRLPCKVALRIGASPHTIFHCLQASPTCTHGRDSRFPQEQAEASKTFSGLGLELVHHHLDHTSFVRTSHKASPKFKSWRNRFRLFYGRSNKVTLHCVEGLWSLLQSVHHISPILRWRKKMKRGWEIYFKCYKIALWQWLPNSINLLKIIELHTNNGWILWYVNYPLVKLLKNFNALKIIQHIISKSAFKFRYSSTKLSNLFYALYLSYLTY